MLPQAEDGLRGVRVTCPGPASQSWAPPGLVLRDSFFALFAGIGRDYLSLRS